MDNNDIIGDLVRNTKPISEEHGIVYMDKFHKLSIFADETIWEMEVIEDTEIVRGPIPSINKFFILDEL